MIRTVFEPRCRRAAAWLCVLWLWASPATGYVLSGPHILDLVVQKLGNVETLRVEQKVVVEDPDLSGEPVELDETLRYILPGRFRSDMRYGNTHRIHVQGPGSSTLTVIDEAIVEARGGRFDRYKDLLLHKSRDALHKILAVHGVDVGISSLGRMEEGIVYVIGAAYPDDAVSQLWVDKERLLPLRWIIVYGPADDATDPERLEFVYRNWQHVGGAWYPTEVETLHNRKSVRRIRALQVLANVVIDGELLNIAHLQTVYKQKEALPQNGEMPDTDVDVEEVQRTLEDFRKKFEP